MSTAQHSAGGGEQHIDDVHVDAGDVEDGLVGAVHLSDDGKSLVERTAPYGVKDDNGSESESVGDFMHNFGTTDEIETNFGDFRHFEI